MGNKASGEKVDFDHMDRRLNEEKDPQVKAMMKKFKNIMEQVEGGKVGDPKAMFDLVAKDGKISKADFPVLARSALNFGIKKLIKEANLQVSGTTFDGLVSTAAVKCVDRFDLHAIALLDRVFTAFDTDGNGELTWEECEALMKGLMQNPLVVMDPLFSFLGGKGAETVGIRDIEKLLNDCFSLLADVGIQLVDIAEDTMTSNDVLRAIENNTEMWNEVFGELGVTGGKITKKQWEDKLKEVPFDEIMQKFNQHMTMEGRSEYIDANMKLLKAKFAGLQETIISGMSENASYKDGLAKWAAALTGGISEDSFMRTVLPGLNKYLAEQRKPENIKKELKEAIDVLKKSPDGLEMTPMGVIFQDGFVDKFLDFPGVMDALTSYSEAVAKKAPILVHHCFRFCDINDDHGVSSKEMAILFAMKDALKSGKLDDAAARIFDVIDKDGNGSVTPGEIISLGSKFIHFVAAMYRIVISVAFETALPAVLKIVVKFAETNGPAGGIPMVVDKKHLPMMAVPVLAMTGMPPEQLRGVQMMIMKGKGKGKDNGEEMQAEQGPPEKKARTS